MGVLKVAEHFNIQKTNPQDREVVGRLSLSNRNDKAVQIFKVSFFYLALLLCGQICDLTVVHVMEVLL